MVQEQEGTPAHANKLVVILKSPPSEGRVPTAETRAETKVFLQSTDHPAEQSDEQMKQEEPSQNLNASDERDRAYRQGNWVHTEILVLLEAKRKEQELFSGSRRSSLSADDKWKFVADYCKSKGVQRTKEQCRIKWDNMQPDYRKVREYEEQREPGAPSYFDLVTWERRSKLLPSNMDAEIYQRIASIHSNKPTNRGLKREAREKKFPDTPPPSGAFPIRTCMNGAIERSNGVECDEKRPWEFNLPVAEFVGKHMASAPRRRRKRRAVERVEPDAQMEPPESADDSSTEDDTTVISSRFQAPSAAPVYLFEEKSPAPQRLAFDSREALPISYREAQNSQQAPERSNGSGAFDVRGDNPTTVAAARQESLNDRKDYEMLSYIEDRKDARHKELLALEREKLAVFREASFAMTNAIAVFSKVAEELLLRRR